jgi:hypothetical protein
MVGKRLERRARACAPQTTAVCHQTRKVFVHGRPTVSISPSRRRGLSKKKRLNCFQSVMGNKVANYCS